MKEYKIDQLRNVGLISHGGAGKTSLTEALLYTAGQITRLGKVDDGNTTSDYTDEEIDRKISIQTALLHFEWKNNKINLLDIPGYADFNGEVYGGLRVCEGAIVLLSALSGVEVGTEQVWDIADRYNLSRILFVNKLDKEHASFDQALKQAQQRFGIHVVPLQIPIGEGLSFKGVVDLLKMRAFYFEKDGKMKEDKVPQELDAEARSHRDKLIEAAAEAEDRLLEKYLDKGELEPDEIKDGLRSGVVKAQLFQVLCGAATENCGTQLLLDKIVELLPAPLDRSEIKGEDPSSEKEKIIKISENSSLCAFVFKTISEPHVGELSYFKIFSGKIKSGDDVYNPKTKVVERIGQIYSLNGRERKEIGMVNAGDVGAFVKLKNTHTGDSLCSEKDPVVLPSVDFPHPVIRMGIRPKSKGDEERIATGFSKLHEEDPTFIMEVDPDIKQTIIHGQGELHLGVMVDKLKKRFGVEVEIEKPRIPYRETITSTKESQGKYKRQSGGRGQYGDVWLKLEPLKRGEGFEFVNKIVGGVVPSKYIPSVEKGVVEAMVDGILAGYRVVDLKVTLYDGSFHEVDSSDLAFKIAGSMGFKNAANQARPVLLEPIYNVEVTVPEEFMGEVMGDLSSRRGKISGMDPHGNFQIIKAQAPLAELDKYSTSLRSLTQGRGVHHQYFSHYEEVPRDLAEKIIEEAKREKEK